MPKRVIEFIRKPTNRPYRRGDVAAFEEGTAQNYIDQGFAKAFTSNAKGPIDPSDVKRDEPGEDGSEDADEDADDPSDDLDEDVVEELDEEIDELEELRARLDLLEWSKLWSVVAAYVDRTGDESPNNKKTDTLTAYLLERADRVDIHALLDELGR